MCFTVITFFIFLHAQCQWACPAKNTPISQTQAQQALEEFCDSNKSHTRPSFRLNAKGAQPWEDTASRTSSRSFPSKTLALRECLCPTYPWTLSVFMNSISSLPFQPPPQKKTTTTTTTTTANSQQRDSAFQPSYLHFC